MKLKLTLKTGLELQLIYFFKCLLQSNKSSNEIKVKFGVQADLKLKRDCHSLTLLIYE